MPKIKTKLRDILIFSLLFCFLFFHIGSVTNCKTKCIFFIRVVRHKKSYLKGSIKEEHPGRLQSLHVVRFSNEISSGFVTVTPPGGNTQHMRHVGDGSSNQDK